MEERVYDKYILEHADIVHLRQPADFKMSRLKPRGVTPYIDKDRRDRKVRVFFGDTAASLRIRLSEYPPEPYVDTISETLGPIYNPYVDKGVLADENALCAGATSGR